MSKNLIHPSAVKKSHSLSPVLQILCFCDGEQLYLLVGITRLPQEPSSEHLFLSSWENKAESSGEHSVMTDPMFWAQAAKVTEIVVPPSVPKNAFPSAMYKHTLGVTNSTSRLSVPSPARPRSWGVRKDGADVQQSLDMSQAESNG